MGNIRLTVGSRAYELYCGDGEEAHLESLARMVDEKAAQAKQVVGDLNESRQLLFAALFLADELAGARRADQAPATTENVTATTDTELLDRIAARLERIAEAL